MEDITGMESTRKDFFPINDSCNKTLLCYMFNKNCKWKDHAYKCKKNK